MQDRPNRPSIPPAVWAGAAAVVLVFALAVTGVVTVLASNRAGSSEAPLVGVSLVPTGSPASPTPSRSAGPPRDPCVIGTWTETRSESEADLFGTRVRLSRQGATHEFYDNGLGRSEYVDNVGRGTAEGRTYEVIHNATISFNWRTEYGMLVYTAVLAQGSTTWKIDGAVRDNRPVAPSLAPDRYTCTGNALRQFGDSYTIDLTRTR